MSFEIIHCLYVNILSNYPSTVSNDPESVQVSTVHERNVSINITTRDDRYSSFLVLVCSNGSCINTYENTNETEDIDVVDLEPATNYTITVYTVNANNLTSRGSKSLNFTTRKLQFNIFTLSCNE